MIILYFTRFALPYDLEAKVGGISEIKINGGLFCISLDLHYL